MRPINLISSEICSNARQQKRSHQFFSAYIQSVYCIRILRTSFFEEMFIILEFYDIEYKSSYEYGVSIRNSNNTQNPKLFSSRINNCYYCRINSWN